MLMFWKKRKPATPPEINADHIVARSLRIQEPGSPFKVEIGAFNGAAGVWVSTGNGNEQIGLCAQKGQGVYLMIWPDKATGLPTAFSLDGIQVHNPDASAAVTIPFGEVIEAVRDRHKPDEFTEDDLDLDPELGFLVHYVLASGPRKGEHRAANISRVWQKLDHESAPGMCNLSVIQDQYDDFGDSHIKARVVGSVLYDPEGKPGTWHWPESIV